MMNRVLDQLRTAGVNPQLNIMGVVMTMFDGRTKLSNEVVDEVRKLLGEKVFDTVVPRTTRLAEAGCSVDEISSITGLSPSMIQKQVYNVRTKVHSKAGIKKLERNR